MRSSLWPLKVFLSLRCCSMLTRRSPTLGNSCEIYSSFQLRHCFLFLFRWACPWPSGQAAFHSVFMQPVSTWDSLSWLLRALTPHNPVMVSLSQLDQKVATRSWQSSQRGLRKKDCYLHRLQIRDGDIYSKTDKIYTWIPNNTAEPRVSWSRSAWLVDFTVAWAKDATCHSVTQMHTDGSETDKLAGAQGLEMADCSLLRKVYFWGYADTHSEGDECSWIHSHLMEFIELYKALNSGSFINSRIYTDLEIH